MTRFEIQNSAFDMSVSKEKKWHSMSLQADDRDDAQQYFYHYLNKTAGDRHFEHSILIIRLIDRLCDETISQSIVFKDNYYLVG